MQAIAGTKNRVIVKYIDPSERTTKSLIYVPTTMEDENPRGVVVVVSDHDELGNKPTVKVGDVVGYFKHGPVKIEVDGEKLLVLKEHDIYAIL